MDTKTINLRDLPPDFVRRAKAHAALGGMTLKDFVIEAVEKAMQESGQSLKPQGKRQAKK
jgi:hypothetical protein